LIPRVASVATAVPAHVVPQETAVEFARGFFADDLPEIDRLLHAFGNTGIERRHLARPVEWYRTPHTFPEKNAVYREVALELSERAAQEAIEASGLRRDELGAIIFVSTTGVATPSLDSHLVQRLGMRRDVARVPIWGLGCAGGAAGLARTAAIVKGLERPALLISVELCSTTFMHDDRSKSNLIATALFGDGAAAVVVGPEGDGPELLGGHSHLVDDSEDVMGWKLDDNGLRVVFARSIPALVRELAPRIVDEIARGQGVEPSALRHLVVHPGGAKVLAAYAEALAIDPERLEPAHAVLRDYGNISGPTALFVLERFLRERPRSGELGLVLGLGPGFSAESTLFRW
jgi:alkylresorcinol/alkylpyrone synthase